MSIASTIVSALSSICSSISQDVYDGDAPFIIYSFGNDKCLISADDKAQIDQTDITISYVVDKNTNYLTKKKNIRKALVNAGFSYPSVRVEYDEDTDLRYIIFNTSTEEESEA